MATGIVGLVPVANLVIPRRRIALGYPAGRSSEGIAVRQCSSSPFERAEFSRNIGTSATMGSSSIFVVEIREKSCERSQGPDQNSPGRERIEQRVVLGAQRSREENTSSVGKVQAASELLGKLVKNMQQLAFDSGLRLSAMSRGGRLCWKRKGRKAVFQFACKPDLRQASMNSKRQAPLSSETQYF
ncbi:hypothetical protein RJ55_07880 [Drechmeria coniospora]|nr:hypothetical protein RJ55_07880 [Drechmeria coniospora]